MLLWALDRAATGLWRVPSQNISNRTTTCDVAMCILALESECGYLRPVEELPLGADASCCWEEGMVGADCTSQTEMASDDVVHHFCTTPLPHYGRHGVRWSNPTYVAPAQSSLLATCVVF